MDMLACWRLRHRIHIHYRVPLSSPSRAVWRRYKPHIQNRYIFIWDLSLIHISEPTRQEAKSYAVFC